jgi:alkanesulfonate monooxygenase SsuD/methylene tetrahydromethanopterin reductase-like flavin-dependent oxidoreductase (luciferase family)
VHLSVALDGAGWHPAAWREPAARPHDLFTPGYWLDVTAEAERGLLDFVTIEDTLGLQSARYGQPDGRTDQVRGRLDAVLVAARVAPRTQHLGLVPSVVTTHTEPFHISKAIATLDYVSTGRAGVRVRVSATADEAGQFGRRAFPAFSFRDRENPAIARHLNSLTEEAADYVEVVRRLWDSWEDDAEIRDAATGRFVDRDKLHYIDFDGEFFSVKGPSITPRPPQGQPVVTALGHGPAQYRLMGRSADVGFITPQDTTGAREIITQIRAAQAAAGRAAETGHVFADLLVYLDQPGEKGAARRQRLDERAGAEAPSDAKIFTGSAADLADLLQDWEQAGLSGFRLRPAVIPDDLTAITGSLVPELQRREAFRRAPDGGTLRERLGLPRPANRYATTAATS